MSRVLIVDDERSIRITLGEFLREAGYAVGLAEDVRAAQVQFAAESWDVVVTDIILPGATGMDLLRWVREKTPDVQVIVMTGEPTVDTAAEAVRAGALDYLPKPITKAAILRVVETASRVKALADERFRLAGENRRYQEGLESMVGERTAQLEARTRQLETVRETITEVTQELDLDRLLMLLTERITALLGAATGTVRLWEEASGLLMPLGCTVAAGSEVSRLPLRLGEGVAGTAAQRRAGLLVNDFRSSPYATPALLESPKTAVLAEPLIYHDRLVGVLSVDNGATGRPFTPDDQALLRLFADQAAIAIENARLYEVARLQAERLRLLCNLTHRLTTSLEMGRTSEEILGAVERLIPDSVAQMWVWESEADRLVLVAMRPPGDLQAGMTRELRWGEALAGRAAKSRRSEFSQDIRSDPCFVNGAWAARHSLMGALAFPLVHQERLEGALVVMRRDSGEFSDEEWEVVDALVGHAAMALGHARLFKTLSDQHDQLRRLGRRLSEADEGDRQRLARGLHDQVGQTLTALGLNLSVLESLLGPDADGQVGRRLSDSQGLLQETVAYIRDVMSDLRPPILDDYGLAPALRWLGERFAERTGVSVAVPDGKAIGRLDRAVETTLFRIAQEALTNATKHARAGRVAITLLEECGVVRLSIEDDGLGFEPRPVTANEPHWGLLSMRERADAVGGRCEVVSVPGQGTRVTVEVERERK